MLRALSEPVMLYYSRVGATYKSKIGSLQKLIKRQVYGRAKLVLLRFPYCTPVSFGWEPNQAGRDQTSLTKRKEDPFSISANSSELSSQIAARMSKKEQSIAFAGAMLS